MGIRIRRHFSWLYHCFNERAAQPSSFRNPIRRTNLFGRFRRFVVVVAVSLRGSTRRSRARLWLRQMRLGIGSFCQPNDQSIFRIEIQKGVLQIDPVDNLTFSWKNLKFGQAFISIECTQSELSISNLSEKPLKISDTKKILHVEKGKTIHIQRRKR